jgi:hypothetical protein
MPTAQRSLYASALPGDWRAIQLSRGLHDVVEFWVENAVMLELMTRR